MIDITEKVIDAVIALVMTYLAFKGVVWQQEQGRKDRRIELEKEERKNKSAQEKEFTARKQAYLENLYEELQHNQRVIHRINRFLGNGPKIENRWAPARVHASYLRTEAWNQIILGGMLTAIEDDDRRLFSVTNRVILEAKGYVEELDANWLRIKEWEDYDKNFDDLRIPADLDRYERSFLPEVEKAMEYSQQRIRESMEVLKNKYQITQTV